MWYSTTSKLPTVAPATFNFMPSWWHRQYGVSFGEKMFADPEYRADTLRRMHRLMHDRFGDVGLGQPDPPLLYTCDDLSNATIPAAFGCEVVFAEDKYPTNRPLSEEQIERLKPPTEITETYPFNEIIRQAKHVTDKHGADLLPSWNTMGVQNIVVQTTGAGFFAEYYQNPPLAKRLLDHSRKLITMSLEYFVSVNNKPETLFHANCTVPLAGPNTYEAFLLDHEQQLYATAARLGMTYSIHHCGHFDRYAPLYRRIEKIDILEIGWGSDLRLVLDRFPEAKVQYIVSHQFVKDGPPHKIREGMKALIDSAGKDVGRLSFNVADIEHGTPDENIRAVVEGLLISPRRSK